VAQNISLHYLIRGQRIGGDSHSSLQPGAEQTEYFSSYSFSSAGDYRYEVTADAVSGETVTGNNSKATNLSVTTPAGKPDIAIQDIWADPAQPVVGENTSLYVQIKNVGDETAKDIRIKYYIDDVDFAQSTLGNLGVGYEATLSESNYTFNSIGTHEYEVRIDAVDGEDNLGNNTKTEFIDAVEAVANELSLNPYLTIFADQIVDNGTEYNISGNISINDVLFFSGQVDYHTTAKTLSGNGRVYLRGIPEFGEVSIYQGAFTFGLEEEVLNGVALAGANQALELAHVPLHVEAIILLGDGIRVEGELRFPELMGHATAFVDALQITRSSGFAIAAGIEVRKVKVAGVAELRDMILYYDSGERRFEGFASIQSKMISVEAGARLINGQLDYVGVVIELGQSEVPIPGTGFSINKGGISLDNMIDGPLTLTLLVGLVPTGGGQFDIVELDNLSLAYTFGRQLSGSGELKIFSANMAQVGIDITPAKVGFWGRVNLIGVLIGETNASISRDRDGSLHVSGNLDARLIIPDGSGFPYFYIRPFLTLPHTVAHTSNTLYDTQIYGQASVTDKFILQYALQWAEGRLSADWAINYSSANKRLFPNGWLANEAAAKAANRFSGQSLRLSREDPNPQLRFRGDVAIQEFQIGDNLPSFILSVAGQSSLPSIAIQTPAGRVAADVENASLRYEFVDNREENIAYFNLLNPLPGSYQLEIDYEDEYLVDIYAARARPGVRIREVIPRGNDVDIFYEVDDVHGEAQIDLFFDNDNRGADGSIFAADIDAAAGRYTWQTDTLPAGTYYVYARASEVDGFAVTNYASTALTIVPDLLAAPQNLQVSAVDTAILLSWDAVSYPVHSYRVYYAYDQVDFNAANFAVGDSNAASLRNIEPGRTYALMVTAMDTLSNESAPSAVVQVNFLSTQRNNSPQFLPQSWPSQVLVGQTLTYAIKTFDADGDALLVSVAHGPAAMQVDGGFNLTWTPNLADVGVHRPKLIIDDGNSGVDSSEFVITVFDSLATKASVAFNRPLYNDSEQPLSISVSDADMNRDPAAIDSVSITVQARAAGGSENWRLYESQANSGVFLASSASDTLGSGEGLFVMPRDTLVATYEEEFPADTISAVAYVDLRYTAIDDPQDKALRISDFRLGNAYPNPFNPLTVIEFDVAHSAHISLAIFNVQGQHIATLLDTRRASGRYKVTWDGRNMAGQQVASGLYFYRFIAESADGKLMSTKKLILMK
jgi:hypothetical protein